MNPYQYFKHLLTRCSLTHQQLLNSDSVYYFQWQIGFIPLFPHL
ncbi:MAG TPA: hypothetical protein IAB31_13075 [Candidatus Choladousia intestinavium]|uniref:Uncharacterized protein n=1 Tax=Candidatus Choladousia intestinavium TaxID=2840727 RepID=A0A9D1ADW5_9FIRM|nr:hypothetical protein [Candidatus Choladousia intestinavium]